MRHNKAIKYYDQGLLLSEQGNLVGAEKAYRKALKLNPAFGEAQNNLGNVLMSLGRYPQAEACYRKALESFPGHPMVLGNVGNALQQQGGNEQSLHWFEQSISADPGYVESYNNLGNALHELGRLEPAIAAYRKAVSLSPRTAQLHANLGLALKRFGSYREAIESLEQAVRIEPNYADAYNNLANALNDLGHTDRAVVCYREALRIDPGYAEAYRHLSALHRFTASDALIAEMEARHGQSGSSDADRMQLCFALAKAYEDVGEFDRSFGFLEQGNDLRRGFLSFDLEQERAQFETLKTVFGEAVPSMSNPAQDDPVQPVFIVGMPRSGTSLVEQILASHCEVYGAGELHEMNRLAVSALSGISDQLARDAQSLPGFDAQSMRDAYLKHLLDLKVPERIISDKLPVNFKWIGFILSAFPEAKIVHVRRDPMATCWSIYKHYFPASGSRYAYNQQDLAAYFRLYRDLMAFWRVRFATSIYELDYERLTEQQEAETRALLEFCGLDWQPQCLDFHLTNRPVKTASSSQVRKEIYRGSSEAWKRYEKHLKPLLDGIDQD